MGWICLHHYRFCLLFVPQILTGCIKDQSLSTHTHHTHIYTHVQGKLNSNQDVIQKQCKTASQSSIKSNQISKGFIVGRSKEQQGKHVNLNMLVCKELMKISPSLKEVQQKTYKESIKYGLSTIILLIKQLAFLGHATYLDMAGLGVR